MIWFWLACSGSAPPSRPATPPASTAKVDLARFRALPTRGTPRPRAAERIALGEQLYRTAGCNDCHPIDRYGTSRTPGKGHPDQTEPRDPPSVLNSALQEAQFFDGRVKTVEEVATAAVSAEVIREVRADAQLSNDLERLYRDEDGGVDAATIGKAIGAYVRTLLTPGRFDRYVAGDADALTSDEVAGLALFVEKCSVCHRGPNLGGNVELGRKIRPLRNVRRTAPWGYDGRYETIEAAIEHHGALAPDEVLTLLDFLTVLTGELPVSDRR